MHAHHAPLFSLTAVVLAAVVPAAGAQEPATEPPLEPVIGAEAPSAAVPEAQVVVAGVAETRFNPTHGTVFFRILGQDFADAGRDARVLVNDATVPPGQTFPTARIVGASYRLPAGLNRIEFTGWDVLGRPLRTQSRIWAGDLALAVDVIDHLGNRPVEAVVTVALEKQPSVTAEQLATAGEALFVDLPDERVRVEARGGSGRTASATVPARQGRLQLRLR